MTIGFVPTMGFLHDGHLSLIETAKQHADVVVVSIFVNPTQFGPNEDLDAYPRSLSRDLELCREKGVAAVFTPGAEDLYGENYQTYVALESLPNHLCGVSRPVHFRGVATVVTKLFHIVMPDVAVFGEKDFQQLAVIRQMVRDLHFPIEIIGGAIVREADGMAMSSRNTYLSEEERRSGLVLSECLALAREMVGAGKRDAAAIRKALSEAIQERPFTRIDYVTLCDPDSLEDVETLTGPTLLALAVVVGKTRLIDNTVLVP